MIRPESAFQRQTADYLRTFLRPEIVCWHTPNENPNAKRGARLKGLGVLAGVPDWVFIGPLEILFQELKTAQGRQSPAQRRFQEKVELLGFEYVLARTLDEFERPLFARGWLVPARMRAIERETA